MSLDPWRKWLRILGGNVAHDAVDADNPVKVGGRAVAAAANPTSVAAGARTDALYTRWGGALGAGHPNVKTVRNNYTSAQSPATLLSVSAGTRLCFYSVSAKTGAGTSVPVSVEIKCGSDYLDEHPGISPGGGFTSPCYGQYGADGADLTVACSVPTDGSVSVTVKYHEEAV